MSIGNRHRFPLYLPNIGEIGVKLARAGEKRWPGGVAVGRFCGVGISAERLRPSMGDPHPGERRLYNSTSLTWLMLPAGVTPVPMLHTDTISQVGPELAASARCPALSERVDRQPHRFKPRRWTWLLNRPGTYRPSDVIAALHCSPPPSGASWKPGSSCTPYTRPDECR